MSVSEMSISDPGVCYPDEVLVSEAGMGARDSLSFPALSHCEAISDSASAGSTHGLLSHRQPLPPSTFSPLPSFIQHHTPLQQALEYPQSNTTPRGGPCVPVPITKLDIESRLLGRSLRSLAELSAYSSTNCMDAGGSSVLPTSGADKTEDSDLESESYFGSEKMDMGD
jgi:hypothetical protein